MYIVVNQYPTLPICLTKKIQHFYLAPLVISHICTVNIYRYKTIETNGNTGVIPTTSKSFNLFRELLKPLWVIYQKMVIYLQRLKEFPVFPLASTYTYRYLKCGQSSTFIKNGLILVITLIIQFKILIGFGAMIIIVTKYYFLGKQNM